MKNLNKIAFITLLFTSFISCDNDNAPVNEEEVITTVITTLTGGGQIITLTSKDLDGDGPNAPIVTVSGNLTIGTTYTGSTTFLNELVDPAEDISEEVEEEGDEHQVFYSLSSSLGTVTYDAANVDANGKPIGLQFSLITSTIQSTGTLTVTLRHLPNKNASGVSNGDITNADGSTDALVTFPIIIQ